MAGILHSIRTAAACASLLWGPDAMRWRRPGACSCLCPLPLAPSATAPDESHVYWAPAVSAAQTTAGVKHQQHGPCTLGALPAALHMHVRLLCCCAGQTGWPQPSGTPHSSHLVCPVLPAFLGGGLPELLNLSHLTLQDGGSRGGEEGGRGHKQLHHQLQLIFTSQLSSTAAKQVLRC
jgi:hypothetical protein